MMRLSGTLGWDEFASFQPSDREVEAATGMVDSLVLLDGFEGWEEAEEWGELRFVERNDSILRRVAIVGEERWRDPMEMFMLKGLRPVEIEYFIADAEEEARAWLARE